MDSDLDALKAELAALSAEVQTLEDLTFTTANAVNVVFVLLSGFLVFLMQGGFAMLEAGSVRTKNTKNVLLKNVLDACCGVIAFYVFGFAFSSGEPSNAFIGYGNFALADFPKEQYHEFFFAWTFAATAATIVSGCVAERTSFLAYLMYTIFVTSFVYPVVAHWIWSPSGWLSAENEDPLIGVGVFDFAGSTVVHVVGGFAGLMGAIIVGPRLGRFDEDGRVTPMPGHSATLVTLGGFLLWFGWYGFNTGSAGAATFVIDDPELMGSTVIQVVAANTTVAAAAGGITVLVLVRLRDGLFDLISSLNGILAGLVSITAGCAVVEPYGAFTIGLIGGTIYVLSSWTLLLMRIDDPLDAYPVHGSCGVWGTLAVGLLATKELMEATSYNNGSWGLFYGGGFRLLGGQAIGVVTVIAWVVAIIGSFFLILQRLNLLRISPEQEMRGNDQIKHGGVAYPEMKTGTRTRRVVEPHRTIDGDDSEYSASDSEVMKDSNEIQGDGQGIIIP